MKFNEDTRVKIPALVHATKLGYKYISLKKEKEQIDERNNIFENIFRESINRINNTDLNTDEIKRILDDITLILDNEDLGESFYKILIDGYKSLRLIDFNNIENNTFNCVTELTYKNGDDEFRPDIIMLINGMPLGFIEVKKPNNRDGILAERNRINARFKNKKFRKFINLTQLLVFSNNQEYNDDSVVPIEGAFYGTPNYGNVFFNCFREEDYAIFSRLNEINDGEENFILKDNNYVAIKGTEEYITNLKNTTPTNKLITSLFSKERILKFLKYGIVYVEKKSKDGVTEIQKHIMRYQQFFATLAIQNKIDNNIKKGIIWHTQGSGKTALAYFNVKYLTDYFQAKGIIAKFYFIVDRLDLLKQACDEFESRGLTATRVNSKDDFIKNIQDTSVADATGGNTINVINIQKFSEDSFVKESDYNVNIQRIYFLDEAHRSYNPRGSFLSNLMFSDKNAIMIALTGTPLLNQKVAGLTYNSKDIFGDYIHKYYYNKSIADGYTLKLIREGIETLYKEKLNGALEEIRSALSDSKDRDVFAHERFTTPLVEYIVKDFKESKIRFDDDSIGAMIVCDSNPQARNVFKSLDAYPELSKILILHDEDDTQTRANEINDFKKGKIDILVVQNMLLTGFDAPRLKKIYLGRVIKEHNLLQTLTRVNRPYKNFKYGYVVDFADIREEFDKTNAEYFAELQDQLGEEFAEYNNIFLSVDEIDQKIEEIKEKLFIYNDTNLEEFTNQVNELNKKELIELKNTMTNYKELYNIIKLSNATELQNKLDINRISKMLQEVERRINIINLTKSENDTDSTEMLNVALSKIDFNFTKISEEELSITDNYKEHLDKVRNEFKINIDQDDLKFNELLREYKNIFQFRGFEDITTSEIAENEKKLDELFDKIHRLNVDNDMLLQKYSGDVKYVKIHKRVKDKLPEFPNVKLFEILTDLKEDIDNMILKNNNLMDTESYFKHEVGRLVIDEYDKYNFTIIQDEITFFADLIVENYLLERSLGLDD